MNDDRVYEELGRNYRFFATWRHLAFAAGAGVWVGVLRIGSDKGLHSQGFALAAFVGALGEIILLFLDARTRAHTQAAVEQGAKLEGASPGFFCGIRAKKGGITHTIVLRGFYMLSAATMLILALIK